MDSYHWNVMWKLIFVFTLIYFSSCISAFPLQWRELESDGPAVLTTEPNARPAPQDQVALWCHSDDVYLLGQDKQLWKYEGDSVLGRWLWLCPAPIGVKDNSYWTIRDLLYVQVDGTLYSHNPLTREWSTVFNNSVFAASQGTACTTWTDPMNNRIFLYGGLDKQNNVLDEMWSFNIETKTWTQHPGSNQPGSLAHGRATRVENFVYLFGGDETNNGLPTSNLLWKMDLATMAWQRVDLADNTQPAARISHVFFPQPEKNALVLFGGRHGSTVYGDMWIFDLENQQWKQQSKGSKPSPRFHAGWCTDDESSTFVIGGAASVSNAQELNNDIWRYGYQSTRHLLAEFFRIDFNAVQLSSTIGGVCSMITLILLVIYGLVACVYKCRKRRQNRMASAVSMEKVSSDNKDDLF